MQKQKRKTARGLRLVLIMLGLVVGAGVLSLGLGLFNLTAQAEAKTQAQPQPQPTELPPTPTVPSWQRPNFHLYLVDEKAAPLSGVRVQLLDLAFAGGKTEVFPLIEAVSNTAGRVSFDVIPYPLNKIYFLRLSEPDGAPILPYDPNPEVLKPGLSIGQADPTTKYLVPVDLTLGSVVYVQKYTIKPLVPMANPRPTATLAPNQPTPVPLPPARRAISRLEGEISNWTYYPPYGSGDLANGGNASGTVTGSPAPLVRPGIGAIPTTTTTSNTSSATNNGSSLTSPTSQTPAAGSGSNSGGSSAVAGNPSVASSSGTGTGSAKPTATIECRGCGLIISVSPAFTKSVNPTTGTGTGTGTASGNSTPGSGGAVDPTATVDNRNGGGRATPTAIPPGVLTQLAEVALRTPANATATALALVDPANSNPNPNSKPSPTTSGNTSPTSSSGKEATPSLEVVGAVAPATSGNSNGSNSGGNSNTTGQIENKAKAEDAGWVAWLLGGLALLGGLSVVGYFLIGKERLLAALQQISATFKGKGQGNGNDKN